VNLILTDALELFKMTLLVQSFLTISKHYAIRCFQKNPLGLFIQKLPKVGSYFCWQTKWSIEICTAFLHPQ
jgi:hypothetical protein